MDGEKLKILGITYTHYRKEEKNPDYEPDIRNLKGIKRPYW